MRAAVYHGRRDIRIEEVPDPEPGPGELLVAIRAAGICGTDAHEYAHGPTMFPITETHPVTGHRGPLVPGHELAGTVIELGEDVSGFEVGDLVVSGAGVSCGTCSWCVRDRTNLCASYATVGLQRPGGLAEYCAVPASTCVDAGPYDLDPDTATLGQPMSIAVHAMRSGRLRPGDIAVVIGVGGIGAFLVYAAAELGATVIASDIHANRLQIASDLGATVTHDPAHDDLTETIRALDAIPTVTYEVSGSEAGMRSALATAQRGTRIVAIGLQDELTSVDLRDLTLRELEMIGTNAHVVHADLPEALRLLASRAQPWADVAPVALSLDRLVPDGLEPMVQGHPQRIKTLVDPGATVTRATTMQ